MRSIAPIFFFIFSQAASQPADSLTRNPYPVEDSFAIIYYPDLQKNSSFYNGRQFYGYSSSIEGYAYYQSKDWAPGSVLYNDLWYDDVQLMYDIYLDEIIVKHPQGLHVILFSERVKQFTREGQVFIYIESNKENGLKKGFYQRLTAGAVTVYAKRVKLLEEKIDGLQLERKFVSADQFFIMRDGMYYPVKKQQDLLKILKGKRQEMYQYKGRLKMRYKENREQFIVSMAEYYNQL